MVDPTFLAIGAVTFLVVLILILRNGAKEEPKKASKKGDKKQSQKPVQTKQQQKPKKGRSALKKGERTGIPSEWQVVVDSAAKDASEVLEFLKGKDPTEIAKQQAVSTKQPPKKKASTKKTKDEVQSSEDSATDDGSHEGFEQVKKRAPADKKKKKKEKKQEETKNESSKPYFRPLNADGTPVKDEKPKKGERKPREPRIRIEGDSEAPQAEGKPKEGDKRERKPRSDGEQQSRERKEGGDNDRNREPREPRPPREPREERRPVTSAPNVKHEEISSLDELLGAITKDYKPKIKSTRIDSKFSRFERKDLLKILGLLAARDLVALSAVNHHFLFLARNEDLWKVLCTKDFGIKDKQTHKTFRLAYRAEYLRRKGRKTKKDDATAPRGEEKDSKAKKNEQLSKEVVQE